MRHSRAQFPDGFEFGAASSAYQIEGSAFGGCGPSHWDTFAATPGNTARGEDGSLACDHFHRWQEDLDLLADCGFDSYRFSTSWARVMPTGRGAVNESGLDFYDRLVDGLLERSIRPYLCLYHWELPAALADLGGWRNRDIADWFAEFAAVVSARLGDRVAATATLNEPWCIAWLSHFLGLHAPGLRDIRAAARAMHHTLLAHGKAIEAMRAAGSGNLGIILNFEHAAPGDDTDEARAAHDRYDAIYNRWFLGGLFRRAYPQAALDGLAPHMPDRFELDFDTIAAPIDWLGVNYYTRKLIAADEAAQFPDLREVEGPLPKTTMGWEIYPDGLHDLLTRIHGEYTGGLPIYVTENGAAFTDRVEKGAIDDPERTSFLDDHLAAVRRAIDGGVPARGYFVWSLLDNYEWALGYDQRFGIVHVDFETMQRTPKGSYFALKHALAR